MTKFALILLCTVMLLGGCYYEIRDMRSSQMYYSPEWVAADGYRGPLTFTDHEGRQRRVEDAHVMRLSRRDYHEIMRDLELGSASSTPSDAN